MSQPFPRLPGTGLTRHLSPELRGAHWRSDQFAREARGQLLALCQHEWKADSDAGFRDVESCLWDEATDFIEYCEQLARAAAANSRPNLLRQLAQLGVADAMVATDLNRRNAAHHAALGGSPGCLGVISQLVGRATVAATDQRGQTPAHLAAYYGRPDCLQMLNWLGGAARDSLLAKDLEDGSTLAHLAAQGDNDECLLTISKMGNEVRACLWGTDVLGQTPAHIAAERDSVRCLKMLHGLGEAARASLTAEGDSNFTPSMVAAAKGNAASLQALGTLIPTSVFTRWADSRSSPAHLAAKYDRVECLQVLHGLGGKAAASLAEATITGGLTPAHVAAMSGNVASLRRLHQLLNTTIQPLLDMHRDSFVSLATDRVIEELEARRMLCWTQGSYPFNKQGSLRDVEGNSPAGVLVRPSHSPIPSPVLVVVPNVVLYLVL